MTTYMYEPMSGVVQNRRVFVSHRSLGVDPLQGDLSPKDLQPVASAASDTCKDIKPVPGKNRLQRLGRAQLHIRLCVRVCVCGCVHACMCAGMHVRAPPGLPIWFGSTSKNLHERGRSKTHRHRQANTTYTPTYIHTIVQDAHMKNPLSLLRRRTYIERFTAFRVRVTGLLRHPFFRHNCGSVLKCNTIARVFSEAVTTKTIRKFVKKNDRIDRERTSKPHVTLCIPVSPSLASSRTTR